MKRFFNKLVWVAGLVITTLLNASQVQAQATIDLGTHKPLAIDVPTGSTFEWHNGFPISPSNLMTAAQIATAGQGVYYGVYHFTIENCYGSVTPLRVIAPVCPATTVDIRTLADSSLKPFGTVVTWHANAPPSSANRMTIAAAMNAASGSTYYTAYYDPIADCYSAYSPIIVLNNPCTLCQAPFLITQSPVCNGTTYSVALRTNGIITTSAGTLTATGIVNIPVGTNVTITATTNCGGGVTATTVVTVTSPTSCTNPPLGCTVPSLSVGQGTCNGTGAYDIAFSASAGATITASAGTVSGNTITNIPIGSNVTVTATNGVCNTSITVNHPADCSTPCATPGASFSAGVCNGSTYSINISNPKNAAISASAGTVGTNAITNIPIGTNVDIFVTGVGCGPQVITVISPSGAAPLITTQSAVCNGTTYSVAFNSNGTVSANAGTLSGNMVTGIPLGTNLVLTATSLSGCATTVETVIAPTSCNTGCTPPALSAGQGVCNGASTYSVAFSSNGIVTVNAGTVTGNMVIGVPVGTSLVLTAASPNGCASSVATVSSPSSCINPPVNCVTPALSAGQGVCTGTGTYNVAFSASAGATVTATAGTISGNMVINIPITSNVVITAANGSCNTSITINHPADCSTPCATPGASFSAGICNGTTYTINFSNPNNANINVSAGTVGANAITGIPIGTSVTITVTAAGCTPQTITINSPAVATPLLTAQSPVCNGTTYSVTFNSNGIVTVNAGTIGGNTVTGIPVGTNLVLTATSINSCASTMMTVISPTTCNPVCTAPVLTAGQGVCSGSGFYSVAFAASQGATVTASAGFVFGNTVFNVPIGSDVTITAAFGTCSTSVIVAHPADCSTPCVSTPASFSGAICNGSTYSVFISNPSGSAIMASAGNVSAGVISGIPIGTNVVITATAPGCMPQVIVISSPNLCTQPDFTPVIDVDGTVVTSAGREFVVNIVNVTNNPNAGQVIFRIRKSNGFSITYNTTATTANVFGGEAVNNSDWDFTETSSFITVTLKAGKTIGSQGSSAIGFKVVTIAGTPVNTSVAITATITNGSGGDSNNANNLATTSIISR